MSAPIRVRTATAIMVATTHPARMATTAKGMHPSSTVRQPRLYEVIPSRTPRCRRRRSTLLRLVIGPMAMTGTRFTKRLAIVTVTGVVRSHHLSRRGTLRSGVAVDNHQGGEDRVGVGCDRPSFYYYSLGRYGGCCTWREPFLGGGGQLFFPPALYIYRLLLSLSGSVLSLCPPVYLIYPKSYDDHNKLLWLKQRQNKVTFED
jgi:hypothetical protein